MSVYTDNGHASRADYLAWLAEDVEVPLGIVQDIANLLGEDEDFDALPIALGDFAEGEIAEAEAEADPTFADEWNH